MDFVPFPQRRKMISYHILKSIPFSLFFFFSCFILWLKLLLKYVFFFLSKKTGKKKKRKPGEKYEARIRDPNPNSIKQPNNQSRPFSQSLPLYFCLWLCDSPFLSLAFSHTRAKSQPLSPIHSDPIQSNQNHHHCKYRNSISLKNPNFSVLFLLIRSLKSVLLVEEKEEKKNLSMYVSWSEVDCCDSFSEFSCDWIRLPLILTGLWHAESNFRIWFIWIFSDTLSLWWKFTFLVILEIFESPYRLLPCLESSWAFGGWGF